MEGGEGGGSQGGDPTVPLPSWLQLRLLQLLWLLLLLLTLLILLGVVPVVGLRARKKRTPTRRLLFLAWLKAKRGVHRSQLRGGGGQEADTRGRRQTAVRQTLVVRVAALALLLLYLQLHLGLLQLQLLGGVQRL